MNIIHNSRVIKAWTDGVPVEEQAIAQVKLAAELPFIFRHIALMPDVHAGIGSTVGSVIATDGAVVPAAVGVDIGCGMRALQTGFTRAQLPVDLPALRVALEQAVPHGRTDNGGENDVGAWSKAGWRVVESEWDKLAERYGSVNGGICNQTPELLHHMVIRQMGTLGTGNHFLEVSLDELDRVWIVVHSGSRGVGAKIGGYFTKLAKQQCAMWRVQLPHSDLAFLPEGSELFDRYWEAQAWACEYAQASRQIMVCQAVNALSRMIGYEPAVAPESFDCRHNYVAREHHFGRDVLITRKGAVSARKGQLGFIPGSMGARSYVVRGLGNPESFTSCSHGAGRAMSRTEAKRRFTVSDHVRATEGIECRKDADVIDETPGAYKDIDLVMAAQKDLVEVVHTLRQVVCVKG